MAFLLVSAGIPFMYRGLPCPYGASVLAATYLLTGGHLVVMRIVAMLMVLFMVDQGFYPHDMVLESQTWKKAIYAGGEFGADSLGLLAWGTSWFPELPTLVDRCVDGGQCGGC